MNPTETKPSSFLGQGWSFPLALDESGKVMMAADEEKVRQSILMILETAPGERLMRPDFGCGIHGEVFAINSASTAGRVAGHVRRALLRWEPRIDLINVDAAVDPRQPNRLLIEIDYVVRSANTRYNLVYPFYLES